MVVAFCGVLLFFFNPESFWDRTPRPKSRKGSKNYSRVSLFSRKSSKRSHGTHPKEAPTQVDGIGEDGNPRGPFIKNSSAITLPNQPPSARHSTHELRVKFTADNVATRDAEKSEDGLLHAPEEVHHAGTESGKFQAYLSNTLTHYNAIERSGVSPNQSRPPTSQSGAAQHEFADRVAPAGGVPPTPGLHPLNSPFYEDVERGNANFDYFSNQNNAPQETLHFSKDGGASFLPLEKPPHAQRYTDVLRNREPLKFMQQLKPYNGRLTNDNWFKVAIRPFILFAYPAVLWSAGVYACAVGWLIVLSESVAVIFRSKETYNFSALSTGLIYLSPFIGGVLGTAVAGKVSDIIVRAMSKRNGGLYEPEFRLVMAAPVAVTTVIGLMGFGWSAQDHDSWIIPTIFFSVISFGCSLGSTTAITFCVDSYRQYAGEALVTLNFSKNVFHGLVFSLFFNKWLEADGSRMVFIWLGIIQLILMAFTIPMYIFGKRARMWTVRMNLMEKF